MSYSSVQGLLKHGISRKNLFRVNLGKYVQQSTNNHVGLLCTSTRIPAIRVNSLNASGQEHMGIFRETPSTITYDKPFNIRVIENSNYDNYRDIRKWLDMCGYNINASNSGIRSHRMRYYDSFVSDIYLTKLEFIDDVNSSEYKSGKYKESLRIRFINAYPIQLDSIDLDSDPVTTPIDFAVAFTYESFIVENAIGSSILGASINSLLTYPILPPPATRRPAAANPPRNPQPQNE